MSKIYLAIPYTGCELESFKIANKISAHLMNQGHIVFSPISMSHPIAMEADLPKGWEFWKQFDEAFLEWCDILYIVVMTNDGWNRLINSTGLQGECEIIKVLGKPIKYIDEINLRSGGLKEMLKK